MDWQVVCSVDISRECSYAWLNRYQTEDHGGNKRGIRLCPYPHRSWIRLRFTPSAIPLHRDGRLEVGSLYLLARIVKWIELKNIFPSIQRLSNFGWLHCLFQLLEFYIVYSKLNRRCKQLVSRDRTCTFQENINRSSLALSSPIEWWITRLGEGTADKKGDPSTVTDLSSWKANLFHQSLVSVVTVMASNLLEARRRLSWSDASLTALTLWNTLRCSSIPVSNFKQSQWIPSLRE